MSFRIPKIRRILPFQRDMARQLNAIAEIVNRGMVVNAQRLQDGRCLVAATSIPPVASSAVTSPDVSTPTTFTDFYCQSGGSNLNAGSDTNNAAKFTSTNGSWSTATNIFTPTDGTNPVSAGVAVGDFASIYIDAATVGVFIARITSVVNAANGAITVDATARAGAVPVTSATARSIKVGGACKGPNALQGYPLTLSNIGRLKDATGHIPRFNLKNDATYSITAVVDASASGLSVIQGYSSLPGDQGKAVIDGGTSLITLLSLGTSAICADIIVQNNGTTGSANGMSIGQQNTILRCVANNIRGNGFAVGNTFSTLVECEAYSCNKSNTSGSGGFLASTGTSFINCYSHDNTGSNNDGFTGQAGNSGNLWLNCIAESNGRNGFTSTAVSGSGSWIQCDAYNNGTDGLKFLNTTGDIQNAIIRNCNFLKNGGYGVNTALTTAHMWGVMDNCGFGTGTMANTSGRTNNTDALLITGNIDYDTGTTPWPAPATGNFTVTGLAAIGAGRGFFTETGSGKSGTVGTPNIGAA